MLVMVFNYVTVKFLRIRELTSTVETSFKYVTKTVIILSLLFLVFNSVMIGTTFASCFIHDHECGTSDTLAEFIGIWLVLPLNSMLNPVVYIVRNKRMRRYFRRSAKDFKKRIQAAVWPVRGEEDGAKRRGCCTWLQESEENISQKCTTVSSTDV